MRLEFSKRHLSISAFPAIELPPLTVVVGLNGSGKTHLLQAIQNGSISNSVAPVGNQFPGPNDGPVRLLSSTSLPLSDGNSYISMDAQPGPQVHLGGFESARRTVLSPYAAQLEQLTEGRISQSLAATDDIWRMGVDEAVVRSGNEVLRPQIEEIFRAAEAGILKPWTTNTRHAHAVGLDGQTHASIQAVASKLKVSPLVVTEPQERQLRPWHADQFQNNLPMLFGRYRDAQLRNRLAQLRDQEDGTKTGMTSEAFLAHFGEAPWEQISATFDAFSLPYEAVAPDLFSFAPVHLTLVKRPGGEPVSISNLSSGEKVLLQFAISSFQYDETIVNVRRPSVLLLDEMDAPLHPEMVHRWLEVIGDGLVAQQGVHCIVTTHSPTTVALAPEAALFEMRDGFSGLIKISKQDALNKLTFGVPTLSIDYSGRRQVFTESDTDAAIYERIYSLVKSKLGCKRELNFISTGMRNKDGGEMNSGCTIVAGVVKRLNETGNMSVFGVVDWDGEAVSTDRVRVIAEGTHDGIENLLLDPLLICLLLLKERRAPAGLSDIERFAGADTLGAAGLQRLSDAIQRKVVPSNSGALVDVSYLDGASTKVLKDYVVMDDHALERKLQEEFPYLKKWSNRGALVMAVIDEVLTEYRGFCPVPLKVMFEGVANA